MAHLKTQYYRLHTTESVFDAFYPNRLIKIMYKYRVALGFASLLIDRKQKGNALFLDDKI